MLNKSQSTLSQSELKARELRERQNDLEDARFDLTEDFVGDYIKFVYGKGSTAKF